MTPRCLALVSSGGDTLVLDTLTCTALWQRANLHFYCRMRRNNKPTPAPNKQPNQNEKAHVACVQAYGAADVIVPRPHPTGSGRRTTAKSQSARQQRTQNNEQRRRSDDDEATTKRQTTNDERTKTVTDSGQRSAVSVLSVSTE